VRSATYAVIEYLLGFLALALFAYLAFGRGPTSDEQFVSAFKFCGTLALIELVALLARTVPANRLIIGANLWLIAGGLAAFLEQWWFLRFYQHFGEASLFFAMLCVGILATAISPAGFIGKQGQRDKVLRASVLLAAAVAIALLAAIYFRGNVKFAAVLPVIALSWLGRLLRRTVPDVA
jgi:ABC-type uncharacterized transport system permease subunit